MDPNWDRFVQEVIERVDLVEFIGRYTTLKSSGSRYMGLCPFHGDNDPSFSISPDVSLWHCFGCKKGGNIFTFVMEKENLSFMEAAEMLGEMCGLELPSRDAKKRDKSNRKEFLDMHAIAERFYADFIRSDKAERFKNYLRERNIVKRVVKDFNIGASPDSWDSLLNHLKKKGYSEDLIIKSGLAIRGKTNKPYDRFRNRLMIPIRDHLNRTVGFGGRVIDDSEPKYLNSSESEIFKKSDLLFAFYQAKNAIKESDSVIIMEGYTDVMRAHQNGINNAVASMGTSLTSLHIKRLSRLTSKFYLAFDSDEAGIKAAVRSTEELIKAELQARIVSFGEGLDPEDYIREKGKDAFIEKLGSAEEGIWFLINRKIPETLPEHEDERIAILKEVIKYIYIVPHKASRMMILKNASIKCGVLSSLGKEIYFKAGKGFDNTKEKTQSTDVKTLETPDKYEREIMKYLICFPAIRAAVKQHVEPSEFTYMPYRKILTILFDSSAPLSELNIENHPQVNTDNNLVSVISELANSFDATHEYTDVELALAICRFKNKSIDKQRKNNRQMLEKAVHENNDELKSRLSKENAELARLKDKYKKGITLDLSRI
ncbi:DNA primase [bacterium]|nr:DNA primase [bacterium]